MSEVRKLNDNNEKRGLKENIIVGSLDVKALYPSLDIDFTSDIVAQTFLESDFQIEEVNTKELGMYLALNKTKEEINEINLNNFCPHRKHRKGCLTITGCATNRNETKRYEPWIFPDVPPDENTTKRAMAEALKIAIKFIMKNHIYQFGTQTKKQKKGGPIGLELTGDLAGIFMMWWDTELMKRANAQGMNILMYKRYVDDINIIMETPQPTNETMNDDEQAIEIIKQIGNNIHPSIQLETDCPSKHSDSKLPLLDIKIWIEKKEDGESDTTSNTYSKIMHEYYYKEVASKSVINARSSLPWEAKRTTITQEILRILLRCSPDLPPETTKGHIQQFMLRLQFSGYNPTFKAQVVKSAYKAYASIIEKDQRGEQPLYRPKTWKRRERQEDRRKKKTTWYKKGNNNSVIFIPATPNSELKKKFENEVKESKLGIRIVEKSGRTIKSLVQRSNHSDNMKCADREKCMVCKEENSKGNCRRENINYDIICQTCGDVYKGETSRNAYSRGLEHIAGLNKKSKDSVLWRHIQEKHPNFVTQPNFIMTVTSTHESALDRQVMEAVNIDSTPQAVLINSKQEFRHNCLWRTTLTS